MQETEMFGRVVGLLSVTLVLCILHAFPASGQSSTSWQIAPRAGVFLPVSALGDVPISTQIEGVTAEPERAKLEGGASVGMSFLRETMPGTWVRLDIDYVPPVDVKVEGSQMSVVQASVASVMAAFEKMLIPHAGVLQPYATLGVGLRSYTFQPSLSAGPQFPYRHVSAATRFGGGAVLRVSIASIGLEVIDQVSLFRFENEKGHRLLNDLHGLLSIRVGL
jgi:hypothetical protein